MDTTHFRAEILKALGQPTRLKIIDFLRDGERCVCEIFPAIGEEQSNTSRHLNCDFSRAFRHLFFTTIPPGPAL